MRKLLFALLMLVAFLPRDVYAKAYFAMKDEMIEKADIIAVVDIVKVEKIESKGSVWTYSQKAIAKVEQLLKGKIPKEVNIYGMEDFICAQCHYEVGKFLLFLKYDKKLLTGSNWQFSIRPIKKDKVEWYKKGGDDRFDLEYLPLSAVLQEIRVIVEKQGSVISRGQALAIAEKVCKESGWEWKDISATEDGGRWIIKTNSKADGSNAFIHIDKITGQVIKKTFGPL
jgi:hypothetical protein